MKFRKHFDYDVQKASDETAIACLDPSLTIQSMAEDADINVLMSRYGITGKMPENPRVPMYGDFTEVTDYRSALEAVMEADERFFELPAKVRARFNNNPQELLEFCSDSANLKEAQSLGLMKEKANGDGRDQSVQQVGQDARASASASAPSTGGHGAPVAGS